MTLSRIIPASLFGLGIVASAFADDASLQRCRAMKDSTQRLACYDAIPLGVAPVPAPAMAPSPSGTAPAPAAAAPAAPASSPTLLQRFGFESRAQPDELPAVESTIPGLFEGWAPRSSFKLANGQVWQVTDETKRTAYLQNPKVKITRGAFGSFFMEIEGIRTSPRVRRVQ
jgi:hypothetical protein